MDKLELPFLTIQNVFIGAIGEALLYSFIGLRPFEDEVPLYLRTFGFFLGGIIGPFKGAYDGFVESLNEGKKMLQETLNIGYFKRSFDKNIKVQQKILLNRIKQFVYFKDNKIIGFIKFINDITPPVNGYYFKCDYYFKSNINISGIIINNEKSLKIKLDFYDGKKYIQKMKNIMGVNRYDENIKDEIILIYENNNKSTIKLFGLEFVQNNKKNCKIIYKEKEYELNHVINFNFNSNETFIEIKLIGVSQISNMSSMFNNCKCLISLPDISEINTLIVTDMSSMFKGCTSLTSLPDLSHWDTSNVENMESMFNDCSSLTLLTGLSQWNTSNVKNMGYMFNRCSALLNIPDISKWDTSSLVNMDYMFNECLSLLSLPDISHWNTSKVNSMEFLFSECLKILYLPDISKWDTSSLVSMEYMFSKCSSLILLPDISNWNTSKVKSMKCLFNECSSLLCLPDISKWDVNKVESMEKMFSECKSLSFIPNISKWNIRYFADLSSMFNRCYSLSVIPDISKWIKKAYSLQIINECISLSFYSKANNKKKNDNFKENKELISLLNY